MMWLLLCFLLGHARAQTRNQSTEWIKALSVLFFLLFVSTFRPKEQLV